MAAPGHGQIIDAEFTDIHPDDGYPSQQPRRTQPAPKRKRKASPAKAKETLSHATSQTPSGDPFGRLDLLVSAGIKQVVANSGDPALFALYGRYGGYVDELAARWLGPVGGAGKGKR